MQVQVNIDMVGIRKKHCTSLKLDYSLTLSTLIEYNPRYFPEPEKFIPSRWYEQEKEGLADKFTAFSIGTLRAPKMMVVL